MATPMEKIPSSARDELFDTVMEEAMDQLASMFGIPPITCVSLMQRMIGTRAACIDRLMQENDEFRIRMCEPGMDALVGEHDCKELAEANFKLAYDIHVERHKKGVAYVKDAANDLLNSVCESHKKGEDK